jgi:hypothetical protein
MRVLFAIFLGLCISVGTSGAASSPKTLEISEQNASLLAKLADYPDLEVLSIN